MVLLRYRIRSNKLARLFNITNLLIRTLSKEITNKFFSKRSAVIYEIHITKSKRIEKSNITLALRGYLHVYRISRHSLVQM